MPRGSYSENVHSDYRETHNTSTINSLTSFRSNQTANTSACIGSHSPNDREYSNILFDSSKNLVLSKFFNSTSENYSTYENLCSGCGYGVFEAHGKLCNFCHYVLNGIEDNSNIYENICDKCSQLYSGDDECLSCSKINKQIKKDNNVCLSNKKTNSKKIKKNLFHSFFGSLKRKKSFSVTNTSTSINNKSKVSNRKLQIVHNVDGFDNVFRTNETFDLSRICELKRLKSSASDHHIYGKLRKSDDDQLNITRYENIKQKSQSEDYLIGGTGCQILSNCSSINSHNSFDDNNLLIYIQRQVDQVQNSVSAWMTSLRCESHDYYSFGAPDTLICNPKSIPAKFNVDLELGCGIAASSSSFGFFQKTPTTDGLLRVSSLTDECIQDNFAQQMVNEFKRNLMEKAEAQSSTTAHHKRAKRQGIYLKLDGNESKKQTDNNYQVNLVGDQQRNDRNCLLQVSAAQAQFEPIDLAVALDNSRLRYEHQLNKRCCIYEKDSEFVTDILQAFDTFLLRESTIATAIKNDEVIDCETSEVLNKNSSEEVCVEINETTSGFNVECVPSKKIDIENIIHELTLSASLNKIVLIYEFSLKVFLSGLSKRPHLLHLDFLKLLKKFDRFQVFLNKQKRNDQTSVVTRSLVNKNIPAIQYIPSSNSDTLIAKENFTNSNIMTVPQHGTTITSNTKDEEDEEPIYQPIWKFKTVGEVQENDNNDEYYDPMPRRCDSSVSLSISRGEDIEDHDEWEPDDEFTFTTKLDTNSIKEPDTQSVNTIHSSSGSTITGYASSISTMTLASTSSNSVTHHIFRNICIFYSIQDPKIRAVLYEYDRNRCSSYFALPINEKGRGVNGSKPISVVSVTSADSTKKSENENKLKKSSESGCRMFPDSVQAWKYLLLDVNYLEDEEDMFVSESEILKAQTIKEMESPPPQPGILQRFKSNSFGNLLDVSAEEEKKSITERMRNKLQRGVFKLQTRSPKESKKSRKFSLYLEDGMKPKYPIFKAPLESLEMNETFYPNVPRFVVDCIEYIERKDCIQMDGLYRASGNKVAIDELKQKLTQSYIYDPKLLITDDIHTLTSLLKMFFRELETPLIPQDTYERLASTRSLMEAPAIENMKTAFKEMKNPNRATLKFLIKHLTTVAHYSSENRMPASNLAIVWGPCLLSANQIEFDIARMNTLAKVLIENYDRIFGSDERLVS